MHQSMDILDCFHLLAVGNRAAMNVNLKVLFEHLFSVLFGLYLGVEFQGHIVILYLTY